VRKALGEQRQQKKQRQQRGKPKRWRKPGEGGFCKYCKIPMDRVGYVTPPDRVHDSEWDICPRCRRPFTYGKFRCAPGGKPTPRPGTRRRQGQVPECSPEPARVR
jgi:hypothetical protein